MVAAVEGAHMMMQCPRCSTRWRVAAAAPIENPLFKCGRCHHLFRQFPGAPPAPDAAAPASRRSAAAVAPAPVEADTLEFIFPERQSSELLLADDATVVDTDTPTMPATITSVAAAKRATVTESTVVVLPAPEPEPPRPAILTGPIDDVAAPDDFDAEDEDDDGGMELGSDLLADPVEGDEPALADFDDDDEDTDDEVEPEPTVDVGRRVRVEDTMRAPAGFGTIMRAIGTAVAGFAALTLMVRVAPEHASSWLAKLPVAGATFAHDRNLATKVELTNVHGRFQRLRNARRVFVISGDARNNSPMTIERIEVAGALYGLGGGELDQKVVTTGNRTALTDLSEAEIVLLQRLDPAIALAPGQTTPFLIVFLEPPRELREFSSRVLSVRPTRRASTPPGASRGSVG